MSAPQTASVRWPKWLIGLLIMVTIPLALEVVFGFTTGDLYQVGNLALCVVIGGALYLAARRWRGFGTTLLLVANLLFLGLAAIVVPDFVHMVERRTWGGLGYLPVALVLGFPWSVGWLALGFSPPWVGWLGIVVNYILLCRLTLARLRAPTAGAPNSTARSDARGATGAADAGDGARWWP